MSPSSTSFDQIEIVTKCSSCNSKYDVKLRWELQGPLLRLRLKVNVTKVHCEFKVYVNMIHQGLLGVKVRATVPSSALLYIADSTCDRGLKVSIQNVSPRFHKSLNVTKFTKVRYFLVFAIILL